MIKTVAKNRLKTETTAMKLKRNEPNRSFDGFGLTACWAVMITSRTLVKFFLMGSFLLFFTNGCRPLHYRPSCDVKPVLAIQMPGYVETLSGCPRDETLAADGRGIKNGEKWCDDIKEFFYFRNGKGEFDCDVEYEFHVFFSEASAIRYYESEKHWRSRNVPVYQEISGDSGIACVFYTEQERADPEGGSVPMGIYHARALFRLRNACIFVTTNERTAKSDKLELATKDLALMLTSALVSTNKLSQ